MSFFTELPSRIKPRLHELAARLITLAREVNQKIPAQRRASVYICGGAAVALLLVVALLAGGAGKAAAWKPPPRPSSRQAVIPPEDIFLPEEPDFLPGVMLGRERRASWTNEDAAPFWQDPLKNGEEQWRQRLESAVDELLERVP